MGYISRDIELDAILTKRGRELLTNKPKEFNITKFSVSDDEIDYRLWNTSHSLGTDYYGELLENTPIIEPLPGEEQQAKFRLISLPKETTNLPRLAVGSTDITLYANQEYRVDPQSIPNKFDLKAGYTLTIWEFDWNLTVEVQEYLSGDEFHSDAHNVDYQPVNGGVSTQSNMTGKGFSFLLKAKEIEDSNDHPYRVTIVANETGARLRLDVIVKGKYSAPLRA